MFKDADHFIWLQSIQISQNSLWDSKAGKESEEMKPDKRQARWGVALCAKLQTQIQVKITKQFYAEEGQH